MTRLTSKGIGNHPHTNMLPKSEIVRRGGYKWRTLEVHLQLRDQRLKTILCVCVCVCIHILLYQNLRVTANQKSTIDRHTTKKNHLKYNTKDSHQTTRGKNKRRREENRAKKTKPKQLIKRQ